MNLSDLQAEIGRLLNDPNNTRWVPSTLTIRINLAQVEIQGYTNAVKTQETLTPIAGQSFLVVNNFTMDIIRATKTLSSGSVKPFLGKTREEIDFLYPDWMQWPNGEPLFWWYNGTNKQINFIPTPDSSNAISNGITLWESRFPVGLVNSTDIPFDSYTGMVPYHMAIVHWVVAQCWQDDATPESLAKSKFHKSGSMQNPGEYEKELGRIMSEFDVQEAVPSHVLFMPQGGRTGSWWVPSKANPIPWILLFGLIGSMVKFLT